MATDLHVSQKVAIVGIGCRFPGGVNDVESFKRMLSECQDCTREPPPDRYDMKYYYRSSKSPGKMYNLRGGYLDCNLEQFDREFFKMSPEEASYLDPQVRLSLEVASEAFEDAGMPMEEMKGSNTGVYMGVTASEYILLNAVPTDNISQYTNSGTNSCMVSNRLSYEFDLRGPSFSIDTACSSSLYAIHVACEALRSGKCDMALGGGVNLLLTPLTSIGFCQAGMLSPDGRCKSFDNSADGYARSEGAGVVVLKPLQKAVEDGDNIYAVIRGGALSNDGRTPGIANPSYNAQFDLVDRACKDAKINPHKVEYIEAHGTGTIVGDQTEATALGNAFGKSRCADDPKLFIGSVKSNFGHTEGAAGVAGVVKVALMQYFNMIPPVVHFQTGNAHVDFNDLNLIVPSKLFTWNQPLHGNHRFSGCSSFGFGGANAHLILEEPHRKEKASKSFKSQITVVFLSAKSKDALVKRKTLFDQYLKTDKSCSEDFVDIAATSFFRATHHRHRCAILAASPADVRAKLSAPNSSSVIECVATQKENLSEIVFVFTGMGSQWWAMGRSLFRTDKTFQAVINHFDVVLSNLGASWTMKWLLTETKDTECMNQTCNAQPAICALAMGLVEVLKKYGITPSAIVGHSVGEVAAAYAAGMLTFEDAVRVIYHRAVELSKTTGIGKMLAVLDTLENVISKLKQFGLQQHIDVAAVNSPNQIVVSGESNSIQTFEKLLKGDGIRTLLLKVNNAFHSFQQDALKDSLLKKFDFLYPAHDNSASCIPMVSTVTGKFVDYNYINTKEYWWNNVRQMVCFQKAVNVLLENGYTTFVEVGAHPSLTPAITDIILSKGTDTGKTLIIETLRRPKNILQPNDDDLQILRTLSTLHCEGYQIDLRPLYPDQYLVKRLPLYPWQRVLCTSVTQGGRQFMLFPQQNHYLLGKKEKSTD